MYRALPSVIALLLAGVALATPSSVDAQVRISMEWNGALTGGPYVYAEIATGGAYVVGAVGRPVYRAPITPRRRGVHLRRGVKIPPGHLPGPGQCRVWHPNRPPGHQPPPFRCADRYHAPYGPSYGPPLPRYRDRWDDDWDDRYDDWEDDYEDWYEDREDEYEDWYDDRRDDWDDDRDRGVRRGPAARQGRGRVIVSPHDRGSWSAIERLAKERQRELRRELRRERRR